MLTGPQPPMGSIPGPRPPAGPPPPMPPPDRPHMPMHAQHFQPPPPGALPPFMCSQLAHPARTKARGAPEDRRSASQQKVTCRGHYAWKPF